MSPYMGGVSSPQHFGLCTYSADSATPNCLAEARWHGIVVRAGVIIGCLSSCDDHKPIMVGVAMFVHDFNHPCGLPESRFDADENVCSIPWDDVVVPALAGELVAS